MQPSKGRIVWYWTQETAPGGGVEYNAIPCMVTAVYVQNEETVVDLTGFPARLDPCFFTAVREVHPSWGKYGRWSWPEKTEE